MGNPRKKNVIFLKNHSPAAKARVDVDAVGSSRSGLLGIYEKALRRFKNIVYLLTVLPLYFVGVALIAASLVPGISLFRYTVSSTQTWSVMGQNMAVGCALALGFFLFGFSLIFLVPTANFILRTYPKTSRGPYYSVDFLKWFVHNALTYIVRYTFLEFITPTPFNILFFKMMGMKIGRGCQINSSNISDPGLIELGKSVTIGGSATLCAHYGQGGYLVLAPVRIGNGVTIGLKASIMGGVEIGDGAKVLPHSVVLPKTIIGAGETWSGVPAIKIDLQGKKRSKVG